MKNFEFQYELSVLMKILMRFLFHFILLFDSFTMNDFNYFPDVAYKDFNEKDQLYHSLVEAAIFNQNSNDYVLSMLTKLKSYSDKNGNDMIIDTLFMKYLIKNRTKHDKEEKNNFNAKLIKKQRISQYIIAYVCFNDPKSKFNFKTQIHSQFNKMLTNEEITVNGIHISKVICYYIFKNLFNITFNDENFDNSNNYNDKIVKNKHNLLDFNFNIHNENDFIKLLMLKKNDKKQYNDFLVNQKNNDLLYIASTKTDLKRSNISGGIYSVIKKDISKGNIWEYEDNKIIEHYKEDFNRFIQKIINKFEGREKIVSMRLYINSITNYEKKIEKIFEMIYMKEYDDALVLLNKLQPIKEIKDILTDELHIETIKELINCASIENACEFIKKFSIENYFTQKEKLEIFFKKTFPKLKISISRNNLLTDSMCEFLGKKIHNKIIRIHYNSESGIDEGGLSKDWFVNINDEIIKSNAFIPTPDGTSLTFNNNHEIDNALIYRFTGQLIGSAFINRNNIGIKLASYIWKELLEEQIELEDMKDYDNEIYESLKWISENDPEDLMMTFVDSDDTELCENGNNIELNENNKQEFIRLMIEKKLIQPNRDSIELIKLGFQDVVDLKLISIFTSNEIKGIVNGIEKIDIEDWKKYTYYDRQFEKNCQQFFTIISKWSQEKLQKLLKFATGSSILPVQGFKYLDSVGGLFQLNFVKVDSNRLPESHTCFNRIDIPFYDSIEKFEDKLSLAIECDTFTIV